MQQLHSDEEKKSEIDHFDVSEIAIRGKSQNCPFRLINSLWPKISNIDSRKLMFFFQLLSS